jgi:hypothetical protein
MYQNTTKLLLNASDVSNMIIQEYVCTLCLWWRSSCLWFWKWSPSIQLEIQRLNNNTYICRFVFLFLNCCLCIWKLSEYKYNNIIPIKSNECLYYKPTYIRIIIQALYFKLNTRTPFSKSEARRTSSETQGT